MTVEGKTNIHITNRITKLSVPAFYKYCRKEITTSSAVAKPNEVRGP